MDEIKATEIELGIISAILSLAKNWDTENIVNYLETEMDNLNEKLHNLESADKPESLSEQIRRLADYIQDNHHSYIDGNGAVDVAINIMKHQQELLDDNNIKKEFNWFNDEVYKHIQNEKYELDDMVDTCKKMLNHLATKIDKMDEFNL